MEVKNLMVEDGFIEELITEFNEKNINFLLIPYSSYQEMHFEYNSKGYIYRFFSFDVKTANLFSKDHLEENATINFVSTKVKKERPGYKKLTKTEIKRSNMRFPREYIKK